MVLLPLPRATFVAPPRLRSADEGGVSPRWWEELPLEGDVSPGWWGKQLVVAPPRLCSADEGDVPPRWWEEVPLKGDVSLREYIVLITSPIIEVKIPPASIMCAMMKILPDAKMKCLLMI